MPDSRLSRIGLLLAPRDPYAPGYREALEHSGLTAERLEWGQASAVADLDVLALAGEGQATEAWLNAIAALLRRGGTVVVSGGTWGLDPLIGVKPHPARVLAHSRLLPPTGPDDWNLWPEGRDAVQFFGGPAVEADGAQVFATTAHGTVGLSYRPIAGGHVLFLAPHLGQTFSQVALGVSVESDGVGPNDGSAFLADGQLRAEDGARLSFDTHRTQSSQGGRPFFGDPFVDVQREVWIRALLAGASATGTAPSLIWTWPESAHATAFMVVDVDEIGDEDVNTLRRTMERYGVRTAWFTTLTNISLELGRTLRKWGDELGLLATGDKAWGVDQLRTQYLTLHRQIAVPVLHSVRATGGQWQGLTGPYEAMEACGARISVAKGGRQPGTQGFLFGTSHPFCLPKRDGAPGPVVEFPQTLWLGDDQADPAVQYELVERTAAVHGTLVVGLRARDARNPAVLAHIETIAQHARERRFRWTTPEQLYAFGRARRGLRRTLVGDGLQLVADTELDPMTVMVAGAGREMTIGGRRVPTEGVRRYGREFTATTFPMDPKSRCEVRVDLGDRARAA